MLVFMTPRVVDEPTEELAESTEPVEKLENVREELESTVPSLE
jgi:hypothetical protein